MNEPSSTCYLPNEEWVSVFGIDLQWSADKYERFFHRNIYKHSWATNDFFFTNQKKLYFKILFSRPQNQNIDCKRMKRIVSTFVKNLTTLFKS